MSNINDILRFQELSNDLGNPFLATMYIVDNARYLAHKENYRILDSEAISWSLRGEKPDVLNDPKIIRPKKTDVEKRMNEILCYVDDEDVCKSVRLSINNSLYNSNLSYDYINISDSQKCARVRILVKMILFGDD